MNKVGNYFKKNSIIEYLIFTVIFITLSLVFAYKTGLIDCGYHFADDYEIFEINKYINSNGLLDAIRYFVVNDLGWRFRPFYFFLRVIRTFVLGTNLKSWHIMLAIETGLHMSLSYVLARKMKVSMLPSLVFPFLYIMGSQDEVLWRLGPQENTGILLLALSLLLLISYYESRRKVYGIFAPIVLIMMMYCKESFLLLGPAVVLFLFFLYLDNSSDKEEKNIFVQLWDFIKTHKVFIISIIISVLISAFIILGYTGLFTSGYAGIDQSYSFKDYIHLTINVFTRDLDDYWVAIGVIIILFVVSIVKRIIKKTTSKQYFRMLFVAAVIIGYSLVSQAVIYGSSSMFTRYYLPDVWIIFFAVIVLGERVIGKIPNTVLVILLLCLSIYNYQRKEQDIIGDAKYFAADGKNITKMLKYVGDLNREKDIIVLTNTYWYEVDYSISTYLQLKEGVKEVYYADEEKEDGNYKNIYEDSGRRISVKDADIILADGSKVDAYDLDNYNVEDLEVCYALIKK